MFGFLAPAALGALGLLAIPILLHIFKPRKVRQTPFSSLRWLRASQHRLSRRIRWHQVLLLLLRLAFLALLVLALAKPILSSRSDAHVRERFILLDTSRSMAYRAPGEAVPLELGKRVAERLVAQVLPSDRTALVLTGARPCALGPLAADAGLHLPRLRAASEELGGADFGGALGLVGPMIGPGRRGSTVDLFLVTDNQVHNWAPRDISRFLEGIEAPVRAHVIDVGPAAMENTWIVNARIGVTAPGTHPVIRAQVRTAGHETHRRTVRLGGLPGFADQSTTVEVVPGTPAWTEFEVPRDYDLDGKVARLTLEPSDGLPGDDVYWLNLDAGAAITVLVIEPQSTAVAELQPGFHLRTAIQALGSGAQAGLELVRRAETDILAPEIERADVVIMVDVPSLSASDLESLEARVAAGAGLVVFLGPGIDAEFYGTRMFSPLRPHSCLLPLPPGDPPPAARERRRLTRISGIDWSHPVLQPLYDPVYGDLAEVQLAAYHRLGSSSMGRGMRVLASADRETPAIVETGLGLGKVVLFNTTANDAWSDLPRRKSFVPLIGRLLDYLAHGARRSMFMLGENVSVPLPVSATNVTVTVETPAGVELEPRPQALGGRQVIQLGQLVEAGAYTVRYRVGEERRSFPFVVQPGRDESLLLRGNRESLRAWWAPADVRFLTADPETGDLDLVDTRVLLDPWLMVLACLILAAEMFFVHWLCPRVNPAVVTTPLAAEGVFTADRGPDSQPAGGRPS